MDAQDLLVDVSQLPVLPATRRVSVDAVVSVFAVRAEAVMAPAEPEVGILEPYPIELVIRYRDNGDLVPVTTAERDMIVRSLRTAYYALEESPCPGLPAPTAPC